MSWWRDVRNQADADQLMELVGGFHDSIIVQIRYEGDGYCDHNQRMAFTCDRRLVVRLDSQCAPQETPSVELAFDGLEELKLLPAPVDCTAIILEGELQVRDGSVCLELNSDIRICAAALCWRLVPKISFPLLWENPDAVDDEVIDTLSAEVAKEPPRLTRLLAPWALCGKECWENFARIIAAQSDAVLEHYAAGILVWLQDLNWPGSMLLFERLAKVRADKIDRAIEECIGFAENVCRDDEWVYFLHELQSKRIKI